MIHNERLVERLIGIWSEWPGRRITSVEAATLCAGDDVEEIRIELADAHRPYFISWQQEDGASDDTLFHWLSMQRASHFKNVRLKSSDLPPILARLRGSVVERIELHGRRELDAVVAAIIGGRSLGVGLATARDLANKGRFSRFGVAELIVTDEERLLRELSRQGMEKIVELRVGTG